MSLDHVTEGSPHVAAHNDERDAINDLQVEVATKVDLPTTPHVGEILRYDGTNWVPSVTRLFEGSGSPEGKVAAPIGSRYVDTAAASGALEYIKRKGTDTSNTGWILSAYADTGLLNISALVDKRNNAAVSTALLRRTGDLVDLYLDLTMPTGGAMTAWLVMNLPVGFRPPATRYGALQDNKEAASNGTYITAGGDVNLTTLTSGKRDRFQGVWLTRDAWPNALPGTAVA